MEWCWRTRAPATAKREIRDPERRGAHASRQPRDSREGEESRRRLSVCELADEAGEHRAGIKCLPLQQRDQGLRAVHGCRSAERPHDQHSRRSEGQAAAVQSMLADGASATQQGVDETEGVTGRTMMSCLMYFAWI